MRGIQVLLGNPLWLFLSVLLFCGCVTKPVMLGDIPRPPTTDKLRVYFKVIRSGEPRAGWRSSEPEFEAKMQPLIARTLDSSGVCELVNASDLRAVLGEAVPSSWHWLDDELALARQVGKALYADYGIIMEREGGNVAAVRYILVNIHTGSTFEAQSLLFTGMGYAQANKEIVKKTWKSLYRLARKDLFQAAMLKGRKADLAESKAPVVRLVDSVPMEEAVAAVVPPAGPTPVVEFPDSAGIRGALPTLAVYDFAADESMRTAAIILADALREELLKLGHVLLVNRENISQVLQEMAISQMGFADDSQAIDAGKALASNQIVTGHIGSLGQSSILQVKRVEVESHLTQFITSTRCPKGSEDLFFDGLPALARDISLGL